ncbi:MAG: hypothetical protein LBG18_04580, partial [Mediterranea sp.]|nr:hypothetical protein [Mediterranea sp.]
IFAGQDWENEKETILFTGLDRNGRSVWGKKIKASPPNSLTPKSLTPALSKGEGERKLLFLFSWFS